MESISFKNFKLFKNKDSSLLKPKANGPKPSKEKSQDFWQNLIRSPFLYMFIFVIVLSYFVSYIPSISLPEPSVGEISSFDIVAPSDLTLEDKQTTEKRKQEVADAILPVYNLDPNVFLNTEERIRGFFSSGREAFKKSASSAKIEEFKKEVQEKYSIEISEKDLRGLIRLKFASSLEENLISLIGKVSGDGIILTKNLFIHNELEKGLFLISGAGSEKPIKVSDILDITESKKKLSQEIDQLELSINSKSFLLSLSNHFIAPNITYNRLETEARKEKARAGIETVFYKIKKGKMILRKGDEVNPEIFKQIRMINQNLRAKPSWWTNFFGTFLLFGLFFVALWYYMVSLSGYEKSFKRFLMIGITLIVSVLFYKLSLFLGETFSANSKISLFAHEESYNFAFPFQFGTLLFAFLTKIHVALVFAVINSLLVGYIFKSNFYLMIFSLIGGFAAIYGIKYYGKQKRTTTLRSGVFLVAPINVLIIIAVHLIRERMGPIDLLIGELLMGIVGGILSSALAFVFLPVFENLFSFTTQTTLLELTNSDNAIFREMAIEAPGSYHHSLIVASLAEKAAEILRLDTMLIKAGALYHDIGKIKRPEYFIENRTKNFDRHKDLKPSMSTLVIINHVKEGVERAKKLKLPKALRDIIGQHHGNSLVKYFYEKAKEKYDPEMQTIGEESYRYAGPKPKSKEAALVMLADSVEAASRSLKSPTKTNLKRVLTEIFNNYLQDGQLDDCEFSLKDLRTTAASFLSTLYTVYHHRVEYPGFDFEMKKKKKTDTTKISNGRNLKQES